MIDVSERRRATEDWQRAQAELSRASRLTTMGVLAASIAHQVNQPLSAVVTNGQAAQRWMRSTPPNLAEAGAALERMIREGNRAAEIIRSIRQVLAPTGGARHRLSLHDVIRQTLTLIDTELASQRVALRLDLAAPSDEIVGDAVQLQQLLLNLLINALDSLRAAHRPAPWLRLATRQSGGNLQVTVEDNGCGLSPEIEPDRLFEPFYGTKPESMGVGLAICHSVVESHGGRIWAEPRPAEGAAFSFTLPLADEESSFGEGRAAES
jgi:C4-dicarboxylate-specific signal transduction histidine kinase